MLNKKWRDHDPAIRAAVHDKMTSEINALHRRATSAPDRDRLLAEAEAWDAVKDLLYARTGNKA